MSEMREAAAWVAEGLGYPINFGSDCPMPQALWDALVDHIHADETGEWHGKTLDREDTESWLAYEAGRAAPTPDPAPNTAAGGVADVTTGGK